MTCSFSWRVVVNRRHFLNRFSNSSSLPLGGHPNPASRGHLKSGQSSGGPDSPFSCPQASSEYTFYLMGTLSPNPWDLTLSRQNGFHCQPFGRYARLFVTTIVKCPLLTG